MIRHAHNQPRGRHRGDVACARWLHSCLRLGWPKSAIDLLEGLWRQYYDANGRWKQPHTDCTSKGNP